jgi:hypothetical protein
MNDLTDEQSVIHQIFAYRIIANDKVQLPIILEVLNDLVITGQEVAESDAVRRLCSPIIYQRERTKSIAAIGEDLVAIFFFWEAIWNGIFLDCD